MTHTYEALPEDPLALIGTQIESTRTSAAFYRLTGYLATAVAVTAIWFLFIAPDEKSPNTLMVEPATEVLSSFIQPTPDMSSLAQQVGFKVDVPNLKRLGVELTTVGEAEFAGQHAAVMQFQHGNLIFLFYSLNRTPKMYENMRRVASGNHQFYVASGGAVSVVAWMDRYSRFHALAAKSTEEDLVALAENVVSVS